MLVQSVRGARSSALHGARSSEYVHAHHAACTTDVIKHVVLGVLLRHMLAKPKPFVYVESHAGAGLYDLHAPEASRRREHDAGIARLAARARDGDALEPCGPRARRAIDELLAAVRAVNGAELDDRGEAARYYPGSPLIAARHLRAGDRMVLLEKDGATARRLEEAIARGGARAAVEVECGDGFARLKGLRAPLSTAAKGGGGGGRGLVFIDPAYESGSELDQTVASLGALDRHWRGARACVWYPLRAGPVADKAARLHQELRALREQTPATREPTRCLVAELSLPPAPEARVAAQEAVSAPAANPNWLAGCGMLMWAPPYEIEDELREVLTALGRLLQETDPAARLSGTPTVAVYEL